VIAQRLPQMSGHRHLGHLDRGAAAVEMALVLPVLLLVLFGLVDFGRAFNTQMQLTQAAREAVRVVAMGQPGDAGSRASAGLVGLTPSPTTSVVSSCPAGNITANAEVTVSYTFHFITPVGAIPGVGAYKTLSSHGLMRCAG